MPQSEATPLAQPDPVAAFSDLLHTIYAASAEPQRWTEALAAIAHALGASRALLFTPFVGPEQGGLLFPWRIEQAHLGLWAGRFIEHDIWALEAQKKGLWREGAVLTDRDMVADEVFRASVFYREFLSQIGIARVCVGVIFGGSPGLPSTSLSVFRGPDDAPFGAAERLALQRLVPHLSRALGLMHRLCRARHQSESLRAALDRLGVAVYLLDQDLVLQHANRAGHQVLARDDGLSLDAQRRLSGRLQRSVLAPRLADWLRRSTAQPLIERPGFEHHALLQRPGQATAYRLQCCALEPGDPLAQGGARFVVFVTDPQRIELPSAAQLAQQLGLSPTEARVTVSLAEGRSYKEVARGLGIGEETVRSHAKAIYNKTRCHNKVALVRLVLSLARAGV
jgi:DNA-binding CsgD family transcriptional regulator/PAS domain-containing protein